jgi:cytochrome c
MNGAHRWRGLSLLERALSVAIFLLVLLQMYQSTKVGTTPRGTEAREALQHLHVSVGITILSLLLPRLWLWVRLPTPERPDRVPPAADALARRCTLALYLVIGALCLIGPFFAWSEGHAVSWFGLVTLPPMVAADYRSSVTLGYLHSAGSFVLPLLFALSVAVALWQTVRYRVAPWRMLPGVPWSGRAWSGGPSAGDAKADRESTPAVWHLVHAAVFAAVIALGAVLPYRIFGVVPFTTDRQLVAAGPPPAVDPYLSLSDASVGPPTLTGRAQKDFMWCRFCHSFDQGGPHGVGPNLHRVFGRRAASAPGFYYSPALVEAGQGGLDWDEASIDRLLADPAAFLDGRHRMRYAPIDDAAARKQVVDALRWATR